MLAEASSSLVSDFAGEISHELRDCISVIYTEAGSRMGGREHFGYRDGVSTETVDIRDASRPELQMKSAPHPARRCAADTLLLSPSSASQPAASTMPAWLSGCSHLVFRRLHQDVSGFHGAIASLAARSGRPWAEIAERVLGRSTRGDSPLRSVAEPPDDDFDYSGDPGGVRCPFSAHVRKVNPRDVERARPIFRRSVSYGPVSASTFDEPGPADDTDRGMLFLAYQASIERQFEYITSNWLNSTSARSVDALVGRRAGTPDDRPVDIGIDTQGRLASYVKSTGAGYFLAPTRTALRHILR